MKVAVLWATALLSAGVWANDGGIVGVKVEDLTMEKVDTSGQEAVRTPLELQPGESVEMTFKGEQVKELMKWLPGGRFVAKDYAKHVRTIAVAAKEGNLVITCADAELSMDKNGKEVWTEIEPSCSVSLDKYVNPVEDEWITDLFGDWQDLDVPNKCRMK